MSDRFPDWDIDKARGEEAEQLVRRLRSALAAGSCEVKCDDQAATTGNVYVEYECKTEAGWRPSGIATTKAADFAFVLLDMRVIVWMPVWLLKNIARNPKLRRVPGGVSGTHPTRGVLVPVDDLLSQARAAVPIDDLPEAA